MINNKYLPVEINPTDDAYHNPKKIFSLEWWYFDAIFDNDYSIHTDYTVYTKNNKIGSTAIEIYYKGELELKEINRQFFKPILVSENYPFVQINDEKIINFDLKRFSKKGEWIYNFSQKLDNCEIDLNFNSTTKGWKIVTDNLSWTVAAPKAKVTGYLTINGKKIRVNGIGYHDHNWNSTLSILFKVFGWFWGKIASDTYNLTWAYLMKNKNQGDLLAIVNKDNNGFFSIKPESISIKFDNFIKSYNRKIPSVIDIKIDDIINGNQISADVKMEIEFTHFKSIIIFPYWRFHIKTDGYISINSQKEKINNKHIMEFFRLA